MDYEYLEDANARDIRYRSFQRSFYGIGGWLMMVIYSTVKNGVSIIISIGIVAPMFQAVSGGEITRISSAWCSVFLLVGLGLLAWAGCRISVGGTRKAMQKYYDK